MFLMACVFMVSLVLAGADEKTTTHELTVTIVAVDAEAKTITIKNEDGSEKTVPVLEKAVASLEKIHAGQTVVLTCQDDGEGNHEGVAAIKPAKE
jgi:hypothetical protein